MPYIPYLIHSLTLNHSLPSHYLIVSFILNTFVFAPFMPLPFSANFISSSFLAVQILQNSLNGGKSTNCMYRRDSESLLYRLRAIYVFFQVPFMQQLASTNVVALASLFISVTFLVTLEEINPFT